MKMHIVRPNERLIDISNKYNITIEEIKSANPHFRSWENIAPGAKINLPNIPQYIQDDIDNVEPFIEDYYPTIDIEKIKKNVTVEKQEVEEENKPKMKKLNYNNYYYSYYNPYNFYNRYYPNKRK